MGPLEIRLYEATVEIFDDRYPLDLNPITDTTRIDFGPIPDSESWYADYHCRAVIRGGQEPSYIVFIPEGELFEVEYPETRASMDADDPPPRVRTFLRTPDLKAADGVVILCCVKYQQYGFRQCGGKPIAILPNPLNRPTPTRERSKALDTTTRAEIIDILSTPEVAPKRPRSGRRTVGEVIDHYKRLEAPVVHSGRSAQASLFGDEPEPALVDGRLPDGTLPGQMSFLD